MPEVFYQCCFSVSLYKCCLVVNGWPRFLMLWTATENPCMAENCFEGKSEVQELEGDSFSLRRRFCLCTLGWGWDRHTAEMLCGVRPGSCQRWRIAISWWGATSSGVEISRLLGRSYSSEGQPSSCNIMYRDQPAENPFMSNVISSFICWKGIIVIIVLNAFRRLFLVPVQSHTSLNLPSRLLRRNLNDKSVETTNGKCYWSSQVLTFFIWMDWTSVLHILNILSSVMGPWGCLEWWQVVDRTLF